MFCHIPPKFFLNVRLVVEKGCVILENTEWVASESSAKVVNGDSEYSIYSTLILDQLFNYRPKY